MFRLRCTRPQHCHPEQSEGSAFPCLLSNSNDLCALRVSELSSLRFTLFTLLQNNGKIAPLFSYSSALFQKECFHNSFPVNHFRTLLQTPGVCLSNSIPFRANSSPGLLTPLQSALTKKRGRGPTGKVRQQYRSQNAYRECLWLRSTHSPLLILFYGIRNILCSFCFELAANACNSFNPPIPQLARIGRKHNSRDCSILWG